MLSVFYDIFELKMADGYFSKWSLNFLEQPFN